MNRKIRYARRFIGSILDALTVVDHIFSRKNPLFYSTEIDPDLITRIHESQTVLIYGSYFRSEVDVESENLSLIALENIWPIIKIANSDSIISVPGWLIRRNQGRDLSLFRECLENFASELSGKNVLWFNSSCVWDPKLLKDSISKLENKNFAGVTGLTDGWIGGYHLQSYFLFFSKEVSTPAINIVISTFNKNWWLKRTLVHRGERRLTTNLKDSSIAVSAMYPSDLIDPENFRWTASYTDNSKILEKLPVPGRKIKSQ